MSVSKQNKKTQMMTKCKALVSNNQPPLNNRKKRHQKIEQRNDQLPVGNCNEKCIFSRSFYL